MPAGRSGRIGAGNWPALFVLAAINMLLVLIVAGRFTPLAEPIAPLTGHFIGIGLAASLAALVSRRRLIAFCLGVLATLVAHAGLGWLRCCDVPKIAKEEAMLAVLPASSAHGLKILALNTWLRSPSAAQMQSYLEAADADVVVLSGFGAQSHELLDALRHTYPQPDRLRRPLLTGVAVA